MPRRKAGTLLPLELTILESALALRDAGQPSFHGFGIAEAVKDATGARSLTGHGTLYKALGRLESFGLLSSSWEPDAGDGEGLGRPRRRLYEVTGEGVAAVERAVAERATPSALRVGTAPA